MLLVLHLVLLSSIVLLLLVALAEILSLDTLWLLLHLLGVRFLEIGGFCLILLFGLLSVFSLGLPGLVCPYVLPLFGLHRGILFLIRHGIPGLLRFVVLGKFVMSIYNTFLWFSWMGSGLLWSAGDVSTAWRVWSLAAEVSLLSAFQLAGGPTPDRRFRCGRGVARFRSTVLGGPVVVLTLRMLKMVSLFISIKFVQ